MATNRPLLPMLVCGVFLMMCVTVALPMPTTGKTTANLIEESAKVAELRQKLQRLHDLLKDYDLNSKASTSSTKGVVAAQQDAAAAAVVKPQEQDQVDNHLPQHQRHHNNGNDVGDVDVDVDVHQPGKDSSKVVPEVASSSSSSLSSSLSAAASHPVSSRSLTSEDMPAGGRRSAERDTDDAMALKQLTTTLQHSQSRQNQDESIQILAKALAQLKDFPEDDSQEDQGVPNLVPLSKENHKPDENDVQTANGQSLEAYILDALNTLDEGRGEDMTREQQPPHHQQQHVHHQKPTQSSSKGQVVVGETPNNKNNDDDDDNDGTDDDDVEDAVKEKLMKALLDARDKNSIKEESPAVEKSEVLDIVERTLIDDIQTANEMGVTIEDIIRDLEEKTYRESILRSVARLIGPR